MLNSSLSQKRNWASGINIVKNQLKHCVMMIDTFILERGSECHETQVGVDGVKVCTNRWGRWCVGAMMVPWVSVKRACCFLLFRWSRRSESWWRSVPHRSSQAGGRSSVRWRPCTATSRTWRSIWLVIIPWVSEVKSSRRVYSHVHMYGEVQV